MSLLHVDSHKMYRCFWQRLRNVILLRPREQGTIAEEALFPKRSHLRAHNIYCITCQPFQLKPVSIACSSTRSNTVPWIRNAFLSFSKERSCFPENFPHMRVLLMRNTYYDVCSAILPC